MDREVIEEKLEALHRCVQRVQGKCSEDVAQLIEDLDLQDICRQRLSDFECFAAAIVQALNQS